MLFFDLTRSVASSCRRLTPFAANKVVQRCEGAAKFRTFATDTAAQSFDGAEKSRTFANFFEAGAPMWEAMRSLAVKQLPTPSIILDLGGGPGEPACHFAAAFAGVRVVATDLAPSMVKLAQQRVAAKGLTNVECMVLDMQEQSAIADSSVDMVIAQMAFQFAPDKPKALQETFRVLKPGGVLVANVWDSEHVFELMPIASGLMTAVTGPPATPPLPNPNGPLGLADRTLFDKLLADAGYAFTDDHNYVGQFRASLGAVSDDQAFKMAALPIWDMLSAFENEGTHPGAWATAKAAFPTVAAPFTDADGGITITGSYRIAVVRKPL